MILGIGATMSVGVIDAYFVGRLGTDALTAISFVFPVQVALQSLGVGVMVGINSVVSRALGAGRRSDAEMLALHGVLLAAASGVLVAATLLLVRTALFGALNADPEVLPQIDDYVVPYAVGYPLVLVAMGLNGVLRGQGAALKSSFILLIVAVVNWILDPLLIVGWGPLPAFGIRGAAYATVVAFGAAALTGAVMVRLGQVQIRLRHLFGAGWWSGLVELGRVGAPAAFSNSVNPLGLTLLTGMLAGLGQELVAGFGVAGRVQSLALVPLLAMSSAIGPVVGQNWGARQIDRARTAWIFSLALCVAYGTMVAVLLVAFRGQLAAVFTDSATAAAGLERYLLLAAWGYGGFGVLIVTNGALNAVGHAMKAMAVSVARVFIVMLPLASAGAAVLGPDAVYASVLAANLFGGIGAFGLGWRFLKQEDAPSPSPLAEPSPQL